MMHVLVPQDNEGVRDFVMMIIMMMVMSMMIRIIIVMIMITKCLFLRIMKVSGTLYHPDCFTCSVGRNQASANLSSIIKHQSN